MLMQPEESLGTHSEGQDGNPRAAPAQTGLQLALWGVRHIIKPGLCLTTAPTGGWDRLRAGSHGETRDEAARLPSGISDEQKKLVKR